jgi:hypothetical protein
MTHPRATWMSLELGISSAAFSYKRPCANTVGASQSHSNGAAQRCAGCFRGFRDFFDVLHGWGGAQPTSHKPNLQNERKRTNTNTHRYPHGEITQGHQTLATMLGAAAPANGACALRGHLPAVHPCHRSCTILLKQHHCKPLAILATVAPFEIGDMSTGNTPASGRGNIAPTCTCATPRRCHMRNLCPPRTPNMHLNARHARP